MSTEALRGTSQHQFLGRRNELSARLEMDRRKGQNGYGRRLRHQTRCDPSGSNLYRRSCRLGSVVQRRRPRNARRCGGTAVERGGGWQIKESEPDVRFEANCRLNWDIAPSPKSADILLQKSQKAQRLIFRQRTKQATIADQ